MLDNMRLLITFIFLFMSTSVLLAQDVNTTPPLADDADNMGVAPVNNVRTSESSTQTLSAPTVNSSPASTGDEPAFEEFIGGSGADERMNEEPLSVPVETIQTTPAKAPEE